MLEKAIKQFYLGKGLETRVTQEAIAIGKLHTLENGTFRGVGKVGKAPGRTAYPTTITVNSAATHTAPSSLPPADKLATYKDELLSVGKNPYTGSSSNNLSSSCLSSWSPTLNAWVDKGGTGTFKVDTHQFQSQVDLYVNGAGIEVIGNVICVAQLLAQSSGSTTYTLVAYLIDATTFTLLNEYTISVAVVGVLNPVRVNTDGTNFYITYTLAGNLLYAIPISPTTLVNGTPQLVVNDIITGVTDSLFDLVYNTGNSTWYLCYKKTGGPSVWLASYASLTSGNPAVPLPSTGGTGILETATYAIKITYASTNNNVLVAYSRAADTRAAAADSTATFITAAATTAAFQATSLAWGGLRSGVFTLLQGTGGAVGIHYSLITSAGVVSTNAQLLNANYNLNSAMFTYNNRDYCSIGTTTGNYLTYIDASASAPLPKYSVLGPISKNADTLYSPIQPKTAVALDSDRFAVLSIRTQDGDLTSAKGAVLSIAVVDFSSKARFKSVEAADSLLFAGSGVPTYDGRKATENNFTHPPLLTNLVGSNGAGALTNLGVYSYVVVYAWVDSNGHRHRSAPSIPRSITLGAADDTVTVTYSNIGLTNKDDVVIEIYRTENGGTLYYKLPETSRILNSKTAGTYTSNYVDLFADSAIISQELLYTTGGELDNDPPYPCYAIANYKNRVVIAGDQGVFFSKIIRGLTPVQFSDAFGIDIDDNDGLVKALGVLDDKLILFKRNRIYYVNGDGPSDTGAVGSFSDPQLINAEFGCDQPQSVCSMGDRIIFKSKQGIMQMDSSFTLTYLGEALDYFLDQNSVVNSIISFANNSQVRVLTDDKLFTYDANVEEWSVCSSRGGRDQVAYDKIYVALNTSHFPIYEDSSHFKDESGNYVSTTIRTGWIQLDAIEAFQRVWRAIWLLRYLTAHTLSLKVFYDYVPKAIESKTFDPATSGFDVASYTDANVYEASSTYSGNANPYQVEIHLAQQKCQAVRFEIKDTPSAGTGESFEAVGLHLVIGLKNQIGKVRPISRV